MKKKMLFVLVLAALVVSGAFAQRVGDTVQVSGQSYTIERVDGDVVTMRKAAAPSFDGVWRAPNASNSTMYRLEMTISGNGGVLSSYATGSNGYRSSDTYIITGSPIIRNIRSLGNNTWSAEFYTFSGMTGNNPPKPRDATSMSWQRVEISTRSANNGGTRLVITGSDWTQTFDKL